MGRRAGKKKKWRFSEIDINNLQQLHEFLEDSMKEVAAVRRKQYVLYDPEEEGEISQEELARRERNIFFEERGAATKMRYFIAQAFHKYLFVPKRSAVMLAKQLCNTLTDEDIFQRMLDMAQEYMRTYACVVNETEEDREVFEEEYRDFLTMYCENSDVFFRNYKKDK